ncbi:MAG: MFS transporter [Candidatus Omnitrophica bacterium]|nr:MFS transporter [Candidatus Omnitrophota bacterium]MBU1809005.1 MFS transporter [Candidatus Omnitrophota bacterium]
MILKNIFRTLRYRNFRIFFMGQNVSLVGTWMQQVAMGWLVYRLTGSALLLGVVAFSNQIPIFILSPLGGVVADRFNRRKLLIITQALSAAQAIILGALTLTGHIQIWHIIALGIVLGCINSFDIPARQSFLVEMVEKKENFGNAIALNSLMFNAARLIGPSIAGLVIALFGEGVCFLVNGISYLAVLWSLFMMRIVPKNPKPRRIAVLEELKEGFKYTFGFAPIRLILLLLSVISAMGMASVVLMPVFARDILKGGPETLGFLMSSVGIGAAAATIYLASRKSIVGLGRLIPVSASVFAVGIILFSLSRTLWISMAVLSVSGFGMMVNMAACNTILQTISEDDKRGRVMSFYTMSFMGMAPIGSLAAGVIAGRIGVTGTLIIGGAICIAATIIFAGKLSVIRKLIHPIYRKIGIIPEIASGINSASELLVRSEE